MKVPPIFRVASAGLGLVGLAFGADDLADRAAWRGSYWICFGTILIAFAVTRGRTQRLVWRLMVAGFSVVAVVGAARASVAWRAALAAIAALFWAAILAFDLRHNASDR